VACGIKHSPYIYTYPLLYGKTEYGENQFYPSANGSWIESPPNNSFTGFLAVDGLLSICSNCEVNLQGRILAIDYGERNIGLAYCDELGLTVQPLPSLPNIGKKDFHRKIKSTVDTMQIRELVIGIPLKMDGTRGDSALHIERIMESLKTVIKLPISGMDERLSTLEAMEFWRAMNPRQQKKYRTLDSLAAALILERYLREQ
jgi:putative holliday junction resolvase